MPGIFFPLPFMGSLFIETRPLSVGWGMITEGRDHTFYMGRVVAIYSYGLETSLQMTWKRVLIIFGFVAALLATSPLEDTNGDGFPDASVLKLALDQQEATTGGGCRHLCEYLSPIAEHP